METTRIILLVILVIIFIVLIVGATKYYNNPSIASPLALRQPQIDPEIELDLYIISTDDNGRTPLNLIYGYKNTTVVFETTTPEFNYSKQPVAASTYVSSNVDVDLYYIDDERSIQYGQLVKVYINGAVIGIIRQSNGTQFQEYLYSMIQAFQSSLPLNSRWLLIYLENQNFEQYNNEFKIYPTILDPTTNSPYNFELLSSLNFNFDISVEIILSVDKGLHIKMRSDNKIQPMYPETTTNALVVDQSKSVTFRLAEPNRSNALGSQEIIQQLFS